MYKRVQKEIRLPMVVFLGIIVILWQEYFVLYWTKVDIIGGRFMLIRIYNVVGLI